MRTARQGWRKPRRRSRSSASCTLRLSSGTAPRGAWSAEFRATLALAWPLVLTNLSQIALATTDVIMMGWLGPGCARRRRARRQPQFRLPDLRHRPRHRDRAADRHRARPQAPFGARRAPHRAPGLLGGDRLRRAGLGRPLAGRADPARARPGAAPRHAARRATCTPSSGRSCRSSSTSCCATSSRRWSGRWPRCGSAAPAIVVNAFLVWVLMFGKLGFPALGLPGAGIGTTLDQHLHGRRASPSSSRSTGASAAIICSAASGGPTGRASARSGGSACRSR